MRLFMKSLVAVACGILYLPTSVQAQSEIDIIINLQDYLDQGGIDYSKYPPIVPQTDPQSELGKLAWTPDGSRSFVQINFGALKQYLDALKFWYPDASIDNPWAIGYMLYIVIHEYAHSDCCHNGAGQSETAKNCREVLADINGAKAACDFVAALLDVISLPPSEFMSELLHSICNNIARERGKYNTAEGRSQAAGCKGWSDSQESDGDSSTQGGCQCTESSWDPPKANPCEDCPDFPNPGDDPDHPFGDGDVIPPCDICDHV